jgi:hypothetical protein
MFGDLKSRPRCNSKVPRTLGAQFLFLNLKFRTRINRFWFIKQNRLNLDVWWFNNLAPVELRGLPRLDTPILFRTNFHPKRFDTNFDVWWFNNPALVELRGPPCLETPIPPLSPQILNTLKQFFILNEFILILDIRWFESCYIPQALEIPIFAWRNTPTKRNEQNTVLVVLLTYIWMILECVQKHSAMGLV